MRKSCSYIILTICIFSSCTSRPLRIARQTLHEADSLRAAGVLFDDSTGIAHAAATLGTWYNRTYYTSDYARANYYYGRLLREHGNQPAAMQCFIRASHTDPETPLSKRIGLPWRQPTTDNYNLLGRIYSNIGSMCHIAGDYALSYDIYDMSSRQFWKANNMTSYYYALNDMAFELSELHKKEEALQLINRIETECGDSAVIIRSTETKAVMYEICELHDSALYCINRLSREDCSPLGAVVKAQALWSVGRYDSALVIANQVMKMPNATDNDRFNMLYILTYNNPQLSKEQIKRLSEERTDIEVEQIEPFKLSMSNAVHLLEQDKNERLSYKSIISISIISFIIILIFIFAVLKIRSWKIRQHQVVEQEYNQLAEATDKAKQEQRNIKQRNQKLKKQSMLLQQNHEQYKQTLFQQLQQTCEAFQQSHNIQEELCWNDFNLMCEVVNKQFMMLAGKLKATNLLKEKEIRLCILVLIGGFSGRQMSDLLFYCESGIRNFKSNTAKKLGTNSKELRRFLAEMAINGHLLPSD